MVGTAGSVDTGAVDDLSALAAFCEAERLWFHVDGAFGALANLSPRLRPLLQGMNRADSLAFDFHKWAQVPYDCGCILVRDPARQSRPLPKAWTTCDETPAASPAGIRGPATSAPISHAASER